MRRLASPARLLSASNQHRPKRPILLAVDQQLGERAALRVTPKLADPLGAVEVGQHQDVEEFGACSWPERVEAGTEAALEFVGPHGQKRKLRT